MWRVRAGELTRWKLRGWRQAGGTQARSESSIPQTVRILSRKFLRWPDKRIEAHDHHDGIIELPENLQREVINVYFSVLLPFFNYFFRFKSEDCYDRYLFSPVGPGPLHNVLMRNGSAREPMKKFSTSLFYSMFSWFCLKDVITGFYLVEEGNIFKENTLICRSSIRWRF